MDQVTLAKNQVRADSWRSLIRECQQSGQMVVQWCQTNNINTKTYYYWLRKLGTGHRRLRKRNFLVLWRP